MDICTAVLAINPSAQLSVSGEGTAQEKITWHGTTPISKADIQAKQAELKKLHDDAKYQRDRKAEYPSIEDQLDKIFHDGVDKWKSEMILPVKQKYPKPE